MFAFCVSQLLNTMTKTNSHHRWHLGAAICSLSILIAVATGCSKDSTLVNSTPSKAKEDNKGINKVEHVIVVYMENHSFDNLYGEFPGANGLLNATAAQYTQIDSATGNAYNILPWTDPAFVPTPNLQNKPFNIDALRPAGLATRDLVHRYYQE